MIHTNSITNVMGACKRVAVPQSTWQMSDETSTTKIIEEALRDGGQQRRPQWWMKIDMQRWVRLLVVGS
jgi:hypothetical protein